MIRLVEAAGELAPHINDLYRKSLDINEAGLKAFGIIDSPLRAAHWLAQGLHETDGGTIIRESGNYSASRLLQIFGAGHSSAAVTPDEAERLAHDGPAIFDRCYGLGNPHLARELGNAKPGDGWAFRGNCWFQTTGRDHHHRFGDRLGVSFEARPELMATDKFAVMPAAFEWNEGNFNALADRNDLRAVTKKLNGGYNGYASREAWFEKAWAILKDPDHPVEAWAHADPDPAIAQIQSVLNGLGYSPKLRVDGRNGPATKAAIKWIQEIAGVKVDGIAGPVTIAAINLRFATKRAA